MIVRRATPADLAALYAGLGVATPRAIEYRSILRQLALGPAWAFSPDGRPIAALAGIVPLDGERVTWFRSGAGAGRAMPGLVRAFRAMLAVWQHQDATRVVTWEQAANPVGQRIARALGFVDTGERRGEIEIWEFAGGSTYWRGSECDRQRPLVLLAEETAEEGGLRGRGAGA